MDIMAFTTAFWGIRGVSFTPMLVLVTSALCTTTAAGSASTVSAASPVTATSASPVSATIVDGCNLRLVLTTESRQCLVKAGGGGGPYRSCCYLDLVGR